ncbi:hypothetical protein PROFUN_02614 [Planoprotostelium fungivorum]|uniref:Uncharacterized protein n=1 Tax=Planoprotostelium fungivorum TaxID=1890364 RepID=A0A2P6NV75_9EUKA|nr:hypothetical protein PROFUN_02614 [Planoprotostelium fungivorum]
MVYLYTGPVTNLLPLGLSLLHVQLHSCAYLMEISSPEAVRSRFGQMTTFTGRPDALKPPRVGRLFRLTKHQQTTNSRSCEIRTTCPIHLWRPHDHTSLQTQTDTTNNQLLNVYHHELRMNYRLLLLLGLMALAIRAQYAVSSVHNDCGSRCQTNTTCCGSDSTCSGNAISQRCCPTGSGFCGCISNRGFCSGSVYNSSSNVAGQDTFGACFDTAAATCTYDPNPNLWIVCPKTHQACESSSFFSCCSPDTYCVTSAFNSSYPICQPRSAPPATTSSSTKSSSIAVNSVHNDCGSTCQSNTTCCGSDSTCSGNAISQRCCPKNSGFCGCISNRGFCSGSVYNSSSSSVSGYDSFGACFDSSAATCTYDPNPNLWIVCPNNYQACKSSSFFSCCSPDTYCVTSISNSSYPICQPRNAAPAASTTTSSVPSTTSSSSSSIAVNSVHNNCGSTCQSNTTCCGSDSTCSGNSISQRCCPNGSGFCGCISNRGFCSGSVYNTSSSSVSGYDSFGACYNPNLATCTYEPSPNLWIVCPKTHQACESSSFFSCCSPDTYCVTSAFNSSYPICQPRNAAPATSSTPASSTTSQSNCGSGLQSCGAACYSPDQYCCPNGQLVQKQFCSATPTPSTTSQATTGATSGSSSGTPSTGSSLCPAPLSQCGQACYSSDQYCCVNNNLVQKPFCPAATATKSATSSSAGPSTDSGNSPSSTKSSSSAPTATNICAGKCSGQSCCATPSGSQCYESSTYQCASDDLGNSQVCLKNLSACGSACYNPSQYKCKNGQLQSL